MKRISVLALLMGTIWACEYEPVDDTHANAATPHTVTIPPSLPRAAFPADNPLTEEGIALGRKLFWDPILSLDSTQSCSSCHSPEFGFTDNGLPTSTGVQGQNGSRNSMPIVNLVYGDGFFWDGRAATLHQLALIPIEDPLEMDENLNRVVQKLDQSSFYPDDFRAAFGTAEVTPERIGLALEQFVLTFISGESKFDRFTRGELQLSASEMRGLAIFNGDPEANQNQPAGDCFHCHGQGLFTNNKFMNNGLDSIPSDLGFYITTGNEFDKGKFKVPSLRNVALTAPYMHDGRFNSLFEVVEFYNSGVHVNSPNLDAQMHSIQNGLNLTSSEIADLVNFLETLTDTAFINNPNFRSPF